MADLAGEPGSVNATGFSAFELSPEAEQHAAFDRQWLHGREPGSDAILLLRTVPEDGCAVDAPTLWDGLGLRWTSGTWRAWALAELAVDAVQLFRRLRPRVALLAEQRRFVVALYSAGDYEKLGLPPRRVARRTLQDAEAYLRMVVAAEARLLEEARARAPGRTAAAEPEVRAEEEPSGPDSSDGGESAPVSPGGAVEGSRSTTDDARETSNG